MPNAKGHSRAIAAGFFLGLLLLTGTSMAKMFPMPDLKGQFTKKSTAQSSQVTLQADQVNFSTADNKAHASGNVVLDNGNQHLYSDQLVLDRVVQQVVAEGDVYLDTPQEQVVAQGMTYNFNDGTGEFRNARVYAMPYQVRGETLDKISDNYMTMTEGYLTTCDLDEPHYRIGAHRMQIFQHDRAVITGMKIYLGKVPVMYLPRYTQDLKNRQILTIIPGEDKDFGLFLLTTARMAVGPHVHINLHADVRERTGLGEGFDLRYDTPRFGSGLISAYYTDENMIPTRHLWDQYSGADVTHHERYRIVWRHKWQIDPNTNAVLQYYKIHDYDIVNNGFLKLYFPREYQQNAQATNLDTYFLLTRNMPHGTLTFDVDTSRENRPIRGIEKIPEIQYIINSQQIGHSGFYVKSTNVFSDLSHQNYPKTFNQKTIRFDTNDEISRPFKLGFISFDPHVGGEETYYTRTADINRDDVLRSMFRGQMDMSTKFYRVWDYHTNFLGLDINRLRHVITPTITYLYQSSPTFSANDLNQFDGIDALTRLNEYQFGLENELQTKRNGQVVDLIRVLTTTTFGIPGTTGQRGFNPFDTNIDITPTDWLTFHDDNEFNWHAGHWDSQNFDATVHGKNWSVSMGDRWTRYQGNQLTGQIQYIINPKWTFSVYGSFPIQKATNGNTTSAREYQYVLTRDLHEWQVDFAIHQLQGQGSEFYVLFRLKAFPNMKFNLINTTFHSSAPGPQNQTGATQ